VQLLASLRQNFPGKMEAVATPPQNLLELRQQLGEIAVKCTPSPQLAGYCRLWARELQRLHDEQNSVMSRTRGQARRLWAEQSLIYGDMIECLETAQHKLENQEWKELRAVARQFGLLTDEFGEALKDMDLWSTSEDLRCLGCGWGGDEPCPHCGVQTLKPVRRYNAASQNYVHLGPLQSEVLAVIMGILEGKQDVSRLREPLRKLHDKYEATAGALMAFVLHKPELAPMLQQVENGLRGVERIARVFSDRDAQSMEDGWYQLFESEQKLDASVTTSHDTALDRVSISNED
jgi:hypothetical protein